eukprot:437144-Alexandrium_andersonii.AAC.1
MCSIVSFAVARSARAVARTAFWSLACGAATASPPEICKASCESVCTVTDASLHGRGMLHCSRAHARAMSMATSSPVLLDRWSAPMDRACSTPTSPAAQPSTWNTVLGHSPRSTIAHERLCWVGVEACAYDPSV